MDADRGEDAGDLATQEDQGDDRDDEDERTDSEAASGAGSFVLLGGRGGPTLSFRGLANRSYYILERDRRDFANYSGCGNTVNGNHPIVREMIFHCLRHWVHNFHVDGFRFDLASTLARELHDSVTQSLYSVTLFAESGRELAKEGQMKRLEGCLDELGDSALQALKEMRLLVYELRPLHRCMQQRSFSLWKSF